MLVDVRVLHPHSPRMLTRLLDANSPSKKLVQGPSTHSTFRRARLLLSPTSMYKHTEPSFRSYQLILVAIPADRVF